MARSLQAKAARDGRLLKKYRCDSHRQSDDPNPVKGIDAPRSVPRHFAHWCSHEMQSQQYQASSGVTWAFK